jgi:hypothetical protein
MASRTDCPATDGHDEALKLIRRFGHFHDVREINPGQNLRGIEWMREHYRPAFDHFGQKNLTFTSVESGT